MDATPTHNNQNFDSAEALDSTSSMILNDDRQNISQLLEVPECKNYPITSPIMTEPTNASGIAVSDMSTDGFFNECNQLLVTSSSTCIGNDTSSLVPHSSNTIILPSGVTNNSGASQPVPLDSSSTLTASVNDNNTVYSTTNGTPAYMLPMNSLHMTSTPSLGYTGVPIPGTMLSTTAGLHVSPTSMYVIPSLPGNNLTAAGATFSIPTSDNCSVMFGAEVKKCHLHSKPQLTCKFCRKYKSAVHQQARLAQQQGIVRFDSELAGGTWTTVEITNTVTYNVNNLLRENILASEYFKSLYSLQTFDEIIDEIFNYADHAEPYCAGNTRAPSTLFCCLYKLFTMRLKEHEVQILLDHTDSPFLRCVGLLYLRYVLPPEKLWDWFSPYFLDDEVFSSGVDKTRTTTIGEYAESLITEDRYFSTVLPRIPVKIKSHDGAQLITVASHRKRKIHNKAHLDQFKPGVPVAACYNGEWLEGLVLSIEGADTGQAACQVQFDDDLIDLIDLGLIIILDAKIRQNKRREERRHRRVSRGLPSLIKKKKISSTEPLINKTQTDQQVTSEKLTYIENDNVSINPTRLNTETTTLDQPINVCEDQSLPSKKDHQRSRSRGDPNDATIVSSPVLSHEKRETCSSPTLRSKKRSVSTDRRDLKDHSKYYHKKRSFSTSRERADSNTRTRPKTQQELLEEFRRRERAKALASGRDYARRPTSYKSSLSLRFEMSTGRKRSRSPPVHAIHLDASKKSSVRSIINDTDDAERHSDSRRGKKNEPSFAHQQRMAQLVERYSKPS